MLTFHRSLSLPVAVAVLAVGSAAGAALPTIDGAPALASVNGEPITLDEFARMLAELHADARESAGGVPQKDPTELLQRLVNLRLVFQEARAIGLDQLPEFEKQVQAFRTDALRGMLLDRVVGAAPPPAAAQVEARYAELAAEVELASAWFRERDAAERFREAVSRGEDFVTLGQRLRERGELERFEPRGFVRRNELAPGIAAALEGSRDGQPSPVVELGPGFAVIRSFGTRVAEDPAAREAAARDAAAAARTAALQTFVDELRKAHLRIDEELLAGLDFDDEPASFERFLEDERVVAHIDGGDPIRVSELARSLKGRMFHGVEQAAAKGRLNRSKANVLEQLTTERLIQDEARRRGLDRLPAFGADLAEHEERVLFGLFMTRAVDPSIEVTWSEVRSYYDEHIADYTDPEMVRLEALSFADGEAARRALERLNAGADLGWMRENARGQLDPADTPPETRFGGRLLLLSGLPPGVADAIAGAGVGDYRLWVETPARHHVIQVAERHVPRPRPVEQVRNEIAARIFAEERRQALDDWFGKLRAASEIEVFVDAEQLRELVSGGATKSAMPR